MERLKARNSFVLDNVINAYEHTADTALDRCTLDFLKELRVYRDAEEQGLLLRLPCKVGDTVYKLINEGISCPILIIQTMFTLQDLPLFEEKRMFLTKEEAEQALADMKEV